MKFMGISALARNVHCLLGNGRRNKNIQVDELSRNFLGRFIDDRYSGRFIDESSYDSSSYTLPTNQFEQRVPNGNNLCPPPPNPRYAEVLRNLAQFESMLHSFYAGTANVAKDAFDHLYDELKNYPGVLGPTVSEILRLIRTDLLDTINDSIDNISTQAALIITGTISSIGTGVAAVSQTTQITYTAYSNGILATATADFIAAISNSTTGLVPTMNNALTTYNTAVNSIVDAAIAQMIINLNTMIDNEIATVSANITAIINDFLAKGGILPSDMIANQIQAMKIILDATKAILLQDFNTLRDNTLAHMEYLLNWSIRLLSRCGKEFLPKFPPNPTGSIDSPIILFSH